MTAPDIIACYDLDTSEPLTNADFFDDNGKLIKRRVVLGAIQVDEKWWMKGYDLVNKIWKGYFKNVKYSGDVVRYWFSEEEAPAAEKEAIAAAEKFFHRKSGLLML